MGKTTLFLLATLVATSASAASYQKTDGSTVNPILVYMHEIVHSYNGPNLGPGKRLVDGDGPSLAHYYNRYIESM